MKYLLLALFCSLSFSVSAHKSENYHMEDLLALQKNAMWHELMNHLQDIRPAKRTKAWYQLVNDSAQAFLISERQLKSESTTMSEAYGLLDDYPFLRKNGQFMRIAGDTTLFILKDCDLSYSDDCMGMLLNVLTGHPDGHKIAFEHAQRMIIKAKPVQLIQLYALAAQAEDNKDICADPSLQKAVEKGLTSRYSARRLSAIAISERYCQLPL